MSQSNEESYEVTFHLLYTHTVRVPKTGQGKKAALAAARQNLDGTLLGNRFLTFSAVANEKVRVIRPPDKSDASQDN